MIMAGGINDDPPPRGDTIIGGGDVGCTGWVAGSTCGAGVVLAQHAD